MTFVNFRRGAGVVLHYLLKTNISPENQWLEDEISFWNGPFLGDIC